jgi:hypothetical protein
VRHRRTFRVGREAPVGQTRRPATAARRADYLHNLKVWSMIVRTPSGRPIGRPAMNSIGNYPEQMYDYVYGHYGLTGLIVAGVGVVVAFVSVMVWFDRRK